MALAWQPFEPSLAESKHLLKHAKAILVSHKLQSFNQLRVCKSPGNGFPTQNSRLLPPQALAQVELEREPQFPCRQYGASMWGSTQMSEVA